MPTSKKASKKLPIKSKAKRKPAASQVRKVKARTPKPKASAVLSAPVFDIAGRRVGQVSLPKETFGRIVNDKLMAQALRVYFSNLHPKTASTKTRAEVKGGGRKPHRQKGTGRARAGSIRSPLWVGGGIVFGPKPKDKKLKLSKKMKRAALASALSQKANDREITVISNLKKIAPKTKSAVQLLKKLKIEGKTLVILESNKQNVKLAMRNIGQVDFDLADSLNAYSVLSHKNLMFEKEAIGKFK